MSKRLQIDQIKKIFAENVRVERARRQWSQEQLAEIANLTRSYVSKLELGSVNATLELVSRVAKGFDMEPYQLLKPADSYSQPSKP